MSHLDRLYRIFRNLKTLVETYQAYFTLSKFTSQENQELQDAFEETSYVRMA